MKIIRREPLFEKIEKALLKAYHHIPAELEAEKKRKLTNDVSPKAQKK
ncbi:hypothetical protein [Runella rosea]|nr:hypothetical protein [Runella rosea]